MFYMNPTHDGILALWAHFSEVNVKDILNNTPKQNTEINVLKTHWVYKGLVLELNPSPAPSPGVRSTALLWPVTLQHAV